MFSSRVILFISSSFSIYTVSLDIDCLQANLCNRLCIHPIVKSRFVLFYTVGHCMLAVVSLVYCSNRCLVVLGFILMFDIAEYLSCSS